MKKPKVRWLVVKIALGLMAFALLWLPLSQEVSLAFSGPARICKHYGVFSYFTDDTHYQPLTINFLPGSDRDVSKLMREGYSIWSQDDRSVVIVRVKDHASTINGRSLVLTCASTVLVAWFAVLRPLRGYLRTYPAPVPVSALEPVR
jgi:hypothetical protein